MNQPQIKLPTPKYKQGDRVWYVRDKDSSFRRAYVCSWKMIIWSYEHIVIKYTVEYDDPDSDDYEDQSDCDYDVAEDRLYLNELDARRKQLELWSAEHTKQQSVMESLDKLREKIMQRILELEKAQE